jgi:hypothetical protein
MQQPPESTSPMQQTSMTQQTTVTTSPVVMLLACIGSTVPGAAVCDLCSNKKYSSHHDANLCSKQLLDMPIARQLKQSKRVLPRSTRRGCSYSRTDDCCRFPTLPGVVRCTLPCLNDGDIIMTNAKVHDCTSCEDPNLSSESCAVTALRLHDPPALQTPPS